MKNLSNLENIRNITKVDDVPLYLLFSVIWIITGFRYLLKWGSELFNLQYDNNVSYSIIIHKIMMEFLV